jgi:DNA polymerase-3 subunit alpha
MNYLWLDVETTGLSEHKCDIIQLACIPVINGVRQISFNEYCQPINWNNIEQEAINTHGITLEMMKTFPQSQVQMLNKFIEYINSFGVRFTIAGYNVSFDKKHISATFSKHQKSSEFFKMFTINVHDTYSRAKSVKSQIASASLKLEALANLYDIPIVAHDALSDIGATIEVDKEIAKLMDEDVFSYAPTLNVKNIEIEGKFPEMAQLHVHSQYNMADGVPLPEEWYEWAEKNGIPGLAIVDQGSGISLFDSIRNEKKTVAVSGIGLNVSFGGEDFFNVNAWATSNEGYNNLVKLASIGFDGAKEVNGASTPILTLEQVKAHNTGLVFGAADIGGAIGKAIFNGDKVLAEQRYLDLATLGELYLEFNPVNILYMWDPKIGFRTIKNNDVIKDGNAQKAYNEFLVYLIDKYQAKAIPVTGASFISQDDKLVQDCLSKTTFADGRHYEENESYHAKLTDQVFKELKVHLGDWLTEDKFLGFIQNTLDITEKAKSVSIKFDHHLPEIQIPQFIKDKTSDYDMQTYYYMMDRIKFHGRWNDDPVYVERFKKELDVIMKNKAANFIPYFLVYEDVSTYSRDVGFLQSIGRGSAGGCLISYYLKIIHVDPVFHSLPFERFLSHARINAGSWPDIDMDISRTARPFVMAYLQKKYGLGFAQVSTFSTMKTKNAIKDAMGAIYGRNRNDFEISAVCDTIPDSPQGVEEKDFLYGYTDDEGDDHKGHLDENEMLRNFFRTYPEVKDLVDKLIGTVRGWSRHASAFVISTIVLRDGRVPTMRMWDNSMNDYIQVSQYNAKMCEKSKLVKADILGLNTLAMISDCVKLVKDKIDYLAEDDKGMALIYRLAEDEGVYTDFYNEKTDSSFQYNTPVVKSSVKQFTPTQRSHLSVMTALLRPGAMDAEFEPGVSAAQWYMDVRQGIRPAKYIHDDLIPMLEETYGVIVYQEQVMEILVKICGYTLEETDRIRDAIAKKKHEVMMSAFGKIREATGLRNWTPEQSTTLCNMIMAFSRYSFNRSHSHAYAELGYITMYLKHHHPLEWWSAVLNNEKKEEKVRHFITLLGDIITPPSLKDPSDKYVVQGAHVVAPVSAIKRVGPASVNELTLKGPFVDLADYIARVEHGKVNKGVVEALIKGRAADSLMDQTIVHYADRKLAFMSEYNRLRGGKITWKPEMLTKDPIEMFFQEKEVNKTFNKNVLTDPLVRMQIINKMPGLQFTGNKHIPFTQQVGSKSVPVISSLRIAEGLIAKDFNEDVGMVMLFTSSNVRKGVSAKTGNPYCFLNVELSDGFAACECVFWKKDRPLKLKENTFVYVRGTLTKGYRNAVSITLKEIEPLL